VNDKLKTEMIAGFVKQGPWAVSFLGICVVFYFVAIKPMAEERTLLVNTLRETNITLTQSTATMAHSIERMEKNLVSFTDRVEHSDHPVQTMLLKKIYEDVEEIKNRGGYDSR